MLSISPQKGVSLIEAMIGLAVASMLMMVGLPSYATWIQNSKIRGAAEAMLGGIQLARGEAVRRNASVNMVVDSSSSWRVSLVSTGELIQALPGAVGVNTFAVTIIPAGANTLTINSLGKVVANADGTPSITQVEIDLPTSVLAASESRELRIVIGGNARLCDPNVADATDPRKC